MTHDTCLVLILKVLASTFSQNCPFLCQCLALFLALITLQMPQSDFSCFYCPCMFLCSYLTIIHIEARYKQEQAGTDRNRQEQTETHKDKQGWTGNVCPCHVPACSCLVPDCPCLSLLVPASPCLVPGIDWHW